MRMRRLFLPSAAAAVCCALSLLVCSAAADDGEAGAAAAFDASDLPDAETFSWTPARASQCHAYLDRLVAMGATAAAMPGTSPVLSPGTEAGVAARLFACARDAMTGDAMTGDAMTGDAMTGDGEGGGPGGLSGAGAGRMPGGEDTSGGAGGDDGAKLLLPPLDHAIIFMEASSAVLGPAGSPGALNDLAIILKKQEDREEEEADRRKSEVEGKGLLGQGRRGRPEKEQGQSGSSSGGGGGGLSAAPKAKGPHIQRSLAALMRGMALLREPWSSQSFEMPTNVLSGVLGGGGLSTDLINELLGPATGGSSSISGISGSGRGGGGKVFGGGVARVLAHGSALYPNVAAFAAFARVRHAATWLSPLEDELGPQDTAARAILAELAWDEAVAAWKEADDIEWAARRTNASTTSTSNGSNGNGAGGGESREDILASRAIGVFRKVYARVLAPGWEPPSGFAAFPLPEGPVAEGGGGVTWAGGWTEDWGDSDDGEGAHEVGEGGGPGLVGGEKRRSRRLRWRTSRRPLLVTNATLAAWLRANMPLATDFSIGMARQAYESGYIGLHPSLRWALGGGRGWGRAATLGHHPTRGADGEGKESSRRRAALPHGFTAPPDLSGALGALAWSPHWYPLRPTRGPHSLAAAMAAAPAAAEEEREGAAPGGVEPRALPTRPILRLAYISGDLRRHAIGWMVHGLFAAHDRGAVKTTAFNWGAVGHIKSIAAEFRIAGEEDDDEGRGRVGGPHNGRQQQQQQQHASGDGETVRAVREAGGVSSTGGARPFLLRHLGDETEPDWSRQGVNGRLHSGDFSEEARRLGHDDRSGVARAEGAPWVRGEGARADVAVASGAAAAQMHRRRAGPLTVAADVASSACDARLWGHTSRLAAAADSFYCPGTWGIRKGACPHFGPGFPQLCPHLKQFADHTAAALSHMHKTTRPHVIVDLAGLTSGSLPSLLAARPAPIMVHYLSGSETVADPLSADWKIMDPVVLPPEYATWPRYLSADAGARDTGGDGERDGGGQVDMGGEVMEGANATRRPKSKAGGRAGGPGWGLGQPRGLWCSSPFAKRHPGPCPVAHVYTEALAYVRPSFQANTYPSAAGLCAAREKLSSTSLSSSPSAPPGAGPDGGLSGCHALRVGHSCAHNPSALLLGGPPSSSSPSRGDDRDGEEDGDDGGYCGPRATRRRIVLVAFHSSFKLDGPSGAWGTWMSILRSNPFAVLWLLRHGSMEPHLSRRMRANAAAAGVHPSRLVFVQERAREVHWRRALCGSLFVDAFRYGAHSSGADALRFGMPVLTLQQGFFASRVVSSLLSAWDDGEEEAAGGRGGQGGISHARLVRPFPLLSATSAQGFELLASELLKGSTVPRPGGGKVGGKKLGGWDAGGGGADGGGVEARSGGGGGGGVAVPSLRLRVLKAQLWWQASKPWPKRREVGEEKEAAGEDEEGASTAYGERTLHEPTAGAFAYGKVAARLERAYRVMWDARRAASSVEAGHSIADGWVLDEEGEEEGAAAGAGELFGPLPYPLSGKESARPPSPPPPPPSGALPPFDIGRTKRDFHIVVDPPTPV